MLQRGMTPEQVAAELQRAASPQYEAEKRAQAEVDALKAEIQAMKNARVAEQAAASQGAVEKRFITEASDARLYPTISDYSPNLLLRTAKSMIDEAGRNFAKRHPGQPIPEWDNADLLMELEKQESTHRKARTQPAATEREVEDPKSKQGTSSQGLVTNKLGSDKTTIPDPGAFPAKGTRKEQLDWIATEAKRRIAANKK